MIRKVRIKNFKSLKDVELNMSKLNLLAGLNGSGKSSFIQSLLLLRQSYKNPSQSITSLILQDGELISLGDGKDIFYQYAKDETIEFEILYGDDVFKWSFGYSPESDVLYGIEERGEEKALPSFNLFNHNFQYLNTEHIPPQISYKKSNFQVIENNNIGAKGEYVVHYLAEYGFSQKVEYVCLKHPKANSTYLLHQANAWLSEVSPGIKLIAEKVKGLDRVRLAIEFETKDGFTNEIKPINTGFGITYVLPVLVAILKARKGDILILENPESHLHPRGQSIIGRMMAYAAQEGVYIIAETHSDHIINGIRVAVKEGKLSPGNTKIFYFDRILNSCEQYSDIKEILIDRNGEISHYPRGFLDEWNEQLMKLI